MNFAKHARRRRVGVHPRRLVVEQLESRRLLAVTPGSNLTSGSNLTTYVLAMATTAEFTQAAGGKDAAQSLINHYVSELNHIFERELAIRFQLHPQNQLLVFENPATDGYTNGSSVAMFGENPAIINRVLNGNANNDSNYDFGHVLGIGPGGGFSGTGLKAAGATTLHAPAKSPTTISLLAHEIGHQLGAGHTFNGLIGNCSGQRQATSAVEPGSGSTIMSYQGGCGSDDLPILPGDGQYFHALSFDEIVRHTTGAVAGRGTRTPTGNTLPSVQAGPDRVIPANTPIVLEAVASDPDLGDELTFTWEQIDAAPTGASLPISPALDATGPLFRSLAPSPDSARIFPRPQELLANVPASQNKNDHLPTQNRELNFRVTARDNHVFNGRTVSGVRSDDVKLTVVNTNAPFQVTSLNTSGQTIQGGSQQSITWNVAGTTGNGINTTNVDIWLSVDGGLTFPIKLASGTNNDGIATVSIPNVEAAQARIKVQADPSQNVFFDVSDANFQIQQNLSGPGGVIVRQSQGKTELAEGLFSQTGLPSTDTYSIGLTQPPTGPVVVTVTADPQTAISLDGINFGATQTLTFAGGDAAARTVTVRALNDSVAEGFHQGRIQQAVTASADPNFDPTVLTRQIVPAVLVEISDDEAPPLIGIELDFPPPNASVPTSWNRIDNPFQGRVNNAFREDGDTSSIDFNVALGNAVGGGWSSRTMDETTIPAHSPELDSIGDVMLWEASTLTATWSDLRPNAKYRVYVFVSSEGELDSVLPVKQTVTISGSGADNPTPFVQDGTGKVTGSGVFKTLHLLVNGQVGDQSKPLEDFARLVTSTNDGKISIQIVPSSGTPIMASAFAIQESFEPVPVSRSWQNPTVRHDVSGDGRVVPLDALQIINELNDPKFRDGAGNLPTERPAAAAFYDVNGDGFVSTNDVLQVINFLNAQPNPEAEMVDALWERVGIGLDAHARGTTNGGRDVSTRFLTESNSAEDVSLDAVDDDQCQPTSTQTTDRLASRRNTPDDFTKLVELLAQARADRLAIQSAVDASGNGDIPCDIECGAGHIE